MAPWGSRSQLRRFHMIYLVPELELTAELDFTLMRPEMCKATAISE